MYPEDSHKSFLINSELKNFTENKFEDQLNKYWMDFVKINFVKYCDPFRKEKKPFLSKIGEFEQQTSVELHLIDLKEQIKDLTVIDNFISEEGEDIFENLYEEFLQNIYFFLDYEPCDLYFENILLLRKDRSILSKQTVCMKFGHTDKNNEKIFIIGSFWAALVGHWHSLTAC